MGTMGVRDRETWVDAAKGISILLVVMVHARSWMAVAGIEAGPVMNEFIRASNHMRMPLFFFAAGLFATKWIARPWRTLVNGKIATLVWVFLVWQVAMFAYKTFAGFTLPDQADAGIVSQAFRVIVSPLRPNAELWFLWALAIYFVVSKLIIRMGALWAVLLAAGVSVIWSGFVLNALGESTVRLMGPGLEKLPMYFVFFVAAAAFSPQVLRQVRASRAPIAAVYLVAWVVVFLVLDVRQAVIGVPGVEFVTQCAGLVAGVAVSVLLAWVSPLRTLGQKTLPVYVTHTTFIVLLASALYATDLGQGPWWLEGLMVWGVLACAVALGLLLFRYTEKTFLFQAPAWFRVRELPGDPTLERPATIR